MPSYLVETFLARGATDERARRDRQASEAAESMRQMGTRVRFGGSIHVPDDEVCFFSFEAASEQDVARIAERAGLAPFRVVEIDRSTAEHRPVI